MRMEQLTQWSALEINIHAHELVVLDGLCGGALDFFSP